MTEYLNVQVLGEWMVSIPIRTDKQREVYESISTGEHEGDTYIAKMNEPVNVVQEKE